MKLLKKFILLLIVAFIIAQFFGPDKNTSEITPKTDFILVENPPEDIAKMLKTSCYDCHSNNTYYPWYNNIAPMNYLIAKHVEDGKKHLDFSIWNTYDAKRKEHKLEEIAEEVEEKKMPLDSYLWMHTEAKLSKEQIKRLTNWVQTQRLKYKSLP